MSEKFTFSVEDLKLMRDGLDWLWEIRFEWLDDLEKDSNPKVHCPRREERRKEILAELEHRSVLRGKLTKYINVHEQEKPESIFGNIQRALGGKVTV